MLDCPMYCLLPSIWFLVAIATVQLHITPRNGLFTWRNSIIEPPRNGLYAWRNSIIITPGNGLYTSRSSIICVTLLNDGISPCEWFILIDGIFPCCKSILFDGISTLLLQLCVSQSVTHLMMEFLWVKASNATYVWYNKLVISLSWSLSWIMSWIVT